jgi:hypothetical protein
MIRDSSEWQAAEHPLAVALVDRAPGCLA